MVKDGEAHEEEAELTGKPSSFKELVISHLLRIAKLSSVELRGGYYTSKVSKGGEEMEIYVEDSRAALENAIYFLAQVLILKFDEDTKKAFDKLHEELETMKQEFLKKTSIQEKEVLGEAYYKDKEKVLLEEYKIRKLNLYRNFFTELCKLLAKKKYFEIGGGVY